MEAAQGGDCPDFEIPSELPALEPFHGKHTAGGSAHSTYGTGGTTTYGTSTTYQTTTGPTTTYP
jgi:hypothetical protein